MIYFVIDNKLNKNNSGNCMNSNTKILKVLISFIIIFYIIICISGLVLNYFYKNITNINKTVSINSEYSNLNLYFLKITKENDVRIKNYGLVSNDNYSYYITFENEDGTTNTFIKIGDIIYLNNIKLCNNVETFKIIVDKTLKPSISVEAKISGKTYSTQYVISS